LQYQPLGGVVAFRALWVHSRILSYEKRSAVAQLTATYAAKGGKIRANAVG
jgi:hypothetical protein